MLVTAAGARKLAVPPLAVVPPVTLYVPVIFSVSPANTIVPAPVKGPFMANVPVPPADPKFNKAPELAAQDPLPVPSPLIFNWPTRAVT